MLAVIKTAKLNVNELMKGDEKSSLLTIAMRNYSAGRFLAGEKNLTGALKISAPM
jgi:hypothetical protein